MFPTEYPEFATVTCLDWKPVLQDDREKDIIIESMRYLVNSGRILIFGFVWMNNHFHLLWQMLWGHQRSNVQRDFLKYAGQQIIKNFRNDKLAILSELLVDAKDRRYQVWERNSLHVPVWSPKVIDQKLEYVHLNPVKAGLCEHPEDYKYSSARFYILNEKNWDFLTHIDG